MASENPSISKRFQWRIEFLAHWLFESFAGLLPATWVFHFGEMMGSLVWHLMPRRRIAVLRNLRIAFAGKKSATELESLARACFRRTGANLLSVAHTARLKPEQLSQVIEMENPEVMQHALAKGRGVVLLLAHMGNWELLSRITHMLPNGTPTGGFYRPLNNPYLDQQVRTRREADGARMFSKGDPFHQACRMLRDGGAVGILADQRVGKQGELTPFFGRITRASPLPALLARRTKAEMVALSVVCRAPGRWAIRYLPVETPTDTTSCMQTLEAAMAASPVDVFWMQERWRCYIHTQDGFRKWLEDRPRSSKPHRFLLWLDGLPEHWQLHEKWLHPDVDYELIGDSPAPGNRINPTRTHSAPKTQDQESLRKCIEQIDAMAALPLDGILTNRKNRQLAKACKEAGILLRLLND